jgi:arabinose-5-phosphate isomerase
MAIVPAKFASESCYKLKQQAAALTEIAERLMEDTTESMDDAVEAIYCADGPIFTTGIGKAGLIARKVSATFTSTGTPCHFIHPVEALHGDAGAVSPDTTIIVFSNSGETEEAYCFLKSLRSIGSVIAVTANNESRIGKWADVVIPLGKIEENNIPTASTTAMMAIGDALALTVREIRGDTVEDLAKNHPGGSIGKRLGPCEDYMRREFLHEHHQTRISSFLSIDRKGKRYPGLVAVSDMTERRFMGVFSTADLLRFIGLHGIESLGCALEDVTTEVYHYVKPDDPIQTAVDLMKRQKISELPVVEDNKLRGMLDITDLIGIFPELREE